MSEPSMSVRRRVYAWGHANSGKWLPWVAALVVFVLAIQSAPEVLDVEAVEGGLLPLVAAAAALPLALIVTRPLLGWLISASSALLVSQVFPILDDDPWPWPPVHGIVLVALLFAVIAVRPPRNVQLDREVVLKLGAWAGTATLFGVLSEEQVGWVLAVTAVAVGGGVARLLTAEIPAAPQAEGIQLPPDLGGELWRSFRTAFLGWPASPPRGWPFGQRFFGDRSWLQWVRMTGPWMLAVVVFAIALADISGNLVVHDLVLPVLAGLVALPVGLMRNLILVGWRIITWSR